MQIIDLFSGIGGFSLAGSWMGWRTIQFCEIDPWCHKVLKKHWPNVPIHTDINTLTPEIIKQSPLYDANEQTIVTGGVPCQPASTAGKRRGESDERWLWPQTIKFIGEFKPTLAVLENVAGLVSMENGKTLDRILSDLEDEGYTTEQVIIPACAVGAWHRRDRIWIVAYDKSTGIGSKDRGYGGQGRRTGHGIQREVVQQGREAQDNSVGTGNKTITHSPNPRTGEDNGGIRQGVSEIGGRERTDKDAPHTRLLGSEVYEQQTAGAIECGEDITNCYNQGLQGGAGQRIQANEGRKNQGNIRQPSRGDNGRLRKSEDNREFESRICGVANDVSGELDENRLNDGKTKERRPNNSVQELRKATCEENNKRENGRSGGNAEEKILRQGMYGGISDKRKSRLSYDAKKTTGGEGSILQTLWNGSPLANTSYRRGLDEQFDRQLDDTLCQLSCEMALAEWEEYAEETIGVQGLWEGIKRIGFMPKTLSEVQKIWQSLTYKTMEWIVIYTCSGDACWAEIPRVPRVATGVKDRVNRLKGLGNAIVPQVAYQIFKAIGQYELSLSGLNK